MFSYEGNVSIGYSFQKFDPEWEEYIDLDEGCHLVNKEKLKEVVTPRLVTPTSSALVSAQ